MISYVKPYGCPTRASELKEPYFPKDTVLNNANKFRDRLEHILKNANLFFPTLTLLISPLGSRNKTLCPCCICDLDEDGPGLFSSADETIFVFAVK